jgi:ketosteroid isomerase-like protein
MHDQESPNASAVNRALVAFAAGNIDEALTQFEEDAQWRRSDLLPEAGTYEGREAIGGLLRSILERLGGRLHVLQLTLYAAGEHVFADYTVSPGSDPMADGSAHVLVTFDVVFGKIRQAREFAFRVRADTTDLGTE